VSNRIYLSQVEFPEELISRLEKFLHRPNLSGSSPAILEFEQKMSTITGNRPAVALSSGTAAIHLALELLGVKKGDDVACQSFTYGATANAITYVGANPVFIDSEEETWNMCPVTLHEYLSEVKKKNRLPKAIVYVHVYGMPAKVEELMKVADDFDVPLIEDAAEAIGSQVSDKHVGQFGKFGIFSFNGNKLASTSGGGMLLSDSKELIQKATYLATQAKDGKQFEHGQVGYNYRIGALNALVGSVQLESLQEKVEARRTRFNYYREALKDISEITWQPELSGSYSNRWLSTLLLRKGMDVTSVVDECEKHDTEVKQLWKPMHLQKSFTGTRFYGKGVAVDLWKRGLCLPSGVLPEDDDLERVVGIIRKVLR